MNRFICIHGHFYQPPRENPWLEIVELQDSAFPYHDWNERVTAECYAPNAHARLVDPEGRIQRIVNSYSRISFNFGPTVLSWMKEKEPEVYAAILQADRTSQARFSGHGSALAQAYNHLIMPLANRRDKHTQTLWGIRDFESRFGRSPEGMWLPETAADDETLDVLAESGLKFTILSPFQAKETKPLAGDAWKTVDGGKIDPSMPYLARLGSGRSIVVFFYDAPLAQAVAFENLLTDGQRFAERLLDGFSDARTGDQLVHIATDGESYGHHHPHGDMALAFALLSIERQEGVKLTIYAEYLANHPPTQEVRIHQATAWSCAHGVDRWRRHCGCNSGGHPSWNQNWREPLRNALDWLRDSAAPAYEITAKKLLRDPWAARDQYIAVILDRSPESTARFLTEQGSHTLDDGEQACAIRLLEMQRHLMLMYTSCGWFFDEVSGPETSQIIQYAARAIQLAGQTLGCDLEPAFTEALSKAKSNLPEQGDGRRVYERYAKPALMTVETAAAHFAISSLFEAYPEKAQIFSFTVVQADRQLFTIGNARLAVGRIAVTLAVTHETGDLIYAVLHMGDHNIYCGVNPWRDAEGYSVMLTEISEAFRHADFPEVIRGIDRHFGHSRLSLKGLFRDEQRKVLNQILASTQEELFSAFRLISDRHTALRRFLADLGAPPPKGIEAAMELALNQELERQLQAETADPERVQALLAEIETSRIQLERDRLAYAIKRQLERLAAKWQEAPGDLAAVQNFEHAAGIPRFFPFGVNLWRPQNTYFKIFSQTAPEMRQKAQNGDENAKQWLERINTLGEKLGFVAPFTIPPTAAG